MASDGNATDGVDQFALETVASKNFYQREPPGDECILCGGDPDPFCFDHIPVETPDGRVYLNVSDDASCVECRKDVVRQLSRRGVQQEGLDAFA